jgi:RHS repeat-associated protein
VYDGDGKRASKAVGGVSTSYVYDVGTGLPALLDDGARKYVWGANGLAYSVDKSGGAVGIYHTDGLGSVRALTDNLGNVTRTYQSDEFGVPLSTQGSGTQPFAYAAEQHDPEDGLVYLRARMYDPSIGRFLQRDRIAGVVAIPTTLNRYGYVLDNPVNSTDPSGRVDCRRLTFACVIGIGAAIGAAANDATYVLTHGGNIADTSAERINNALVGARNGAMATAAGLITGGAATFIGLADGTISFTSGFVSNLVSATLSSDPSAPVIQNVLSIGLSSVVRGYVGQLVAALVPGAAFRQLGLTIDVPMNGPVGINGSFDMNPVAMFQELWFDVTTSVLNADINIAISSARGALKSIVLR